MNVAVIVEGEAELVFCFYLIVMLHPNSKINSIVLNKDAILNSGHLKKFQLENPNPTNVFWIFSASNDSSILSAIINRVKFFESKDIELIVGLRDVYSEEFRNDYGKDTSRAREFKTTKRTNFKKFIREKTELDNDKCFLYFGVMEIEAWFLGMVPVITKAYNLQIQDIEKTLGLNLNDVDPETEFVHPKETIKKICPQYDSKKSQIEKIMRCVELCHLEDLNTMNKCKSFSCFFQKISKLA